MFLETIRDTRCGMGINTKECLNIVYDYDAFWLLFIKRRRKERKKSLSLRDTHFHLQELTKDEMSGICFRILRGKKR